MLCLRHHALLFLSFLIDPVENAFPFSKGGNRWTQRGKTKILTDLTVARFCQLAGQITDEQIEKACATALEQATPTIPEAMEIVRSATQSHVAAIALAAEKCL